MKASRILIASIGVGIALGAFTWVWAGHKAHAQHALLASKPKAILGAKEGDADGKPDYYDLQRYFEIERAYPNDTIDWSMYRRAAQTQHNNPPSLPPGTTWQFLGPNNLDSPNVGGNNIYQGLSPLGGRVNCVAFGAGNTIFAGSATGGFWKATYPATGANAWTELSNWGQNNGGTGAWTTLACSCCAVDPTGQYIVVGTGDFAGMRPSPPGPMGLMISNNGGQFWFSVDAFMEGGAGGYEPQVSRVALDPDTFTNSGGGNVVATTGRYSGGSTSGGGINGLAGQVSGDYTTTGHLWVSFDQGITWQQAAGVAGGAAPPAAVWSACTISPRSLTTGLRYYYAVCWVPPIGTGGAQIWRSDDQGNTWHQVANPFANKTQFSLDIACSPIYSDNVYVVSGGGTEYFNDVVGGTPYGDSMVWQSTNGGNTWPNNITGNFPNDGGVGGAGYNWTQASYDYTLAVTSQNPGGGAPLNDWVFLGMIDVASAVQDGVNNARWTWQGHAYDTAAAQCYTHNDDHALAFNNPGMPNRALFGNDGGCAGMTLAANTATFTPFNQALPVEEFYNMAFQPNEGVGQQSYYLGGCQDIATPYFKTGLATNAANKWNNPLYPGDGGYCGITNGTPKTQFFAGYNNGGTIPVYTTTNAWTENPILTLNLTAAADRSAFIPPMIELQTRLPKNLLLGMNHLWWYNGAAWQIYVNRPDGVQTQEIKPGSTTDYIRSIATSTNELYFYTGSLEGSVWMNNNVGVWSEIDAGGLPGQAITGIVVNPNNSTQIWVTISGPSGAGAGGAVGRVWYCANTAATPPVWTNVSGIGVGGIPIPDIPACCITVNPANVQQLWVGTDMGVYATTNGGTSWFSMTGGSYGLPPVSVRSIAYQTVAATNYLSVATFGRGAYEYTTAVGGAIGGRGPGGTVIAGPAP